MTTSDTNTIKTSIDELTRFTIRLPKELLDKVKANAKENKRSAAKEIEFALEKFYFKN